MKHFKLKHLIINPFISLFAYLLIYLFSSPAYAQATSFTVSPPRNEISLNPGESYSNDIKITNNNDSPIEVSVNINNFIVTDENGTPNPIIDNNSPYSLILWITYSPNTLKIAPHQFDNLTYTINIPNNAVPGGHYAMFTFTPNAPKNSNLIAVSSQIASLINVVVSGNINEKAILKNLTKNYNFAEDKLNLRTNVYNLGNVHIKPVLYASIYSMDKTFISSKAFPVFNIFPNAGRIYKEEFTIPWWLPGKYTLKIIGSYGKHTLYYTTSFWAVSEKFMLVILLIFIAIATFTAKKIVKKKNKENKTITPLISDLQ